MSNSDKPALFASRRQMLKAAAGCSMMTNTALLSTLTNLQATKAWAGDHNPTDYKAIVCLFLFGGNDSYNMLTPYDGVGEGSITNETGAPPLIANGEFGDYYLTRGGYDNNVEDPTNQNPPQVRYNAGGLALKQSSLLPINAGDPNNASRQLGLHEGFASDASATESAARGRTPGIEGLYNSGKLGFVSNVGSLLDVTTKADYQARINLPLGLFSHSDLQRHWMTGVPDSRSQIRGWAGKMADCFRATNLNPAVSMNISIAGMNLFQTGQHVVPYAIGTSGATVVSNYYKDVTQTGSIQDKIFSRSMDNMLNDVYTDLLESTLKDSCRNSIDAAINFNTAINAVDISPVTFAGDGLSTRFQTLAKVIGAADDLQQKRQIFFISEGGFDNHNNVVAAQTNSMPRISNALTSFYKALEHLGLQDEVLTFTASDFARTLGTNGQGSDHAWGGNQIIMGGKVDGGKTYGQYPDTLAAGSALDLGRGRLIPTTSVDEMAADIGMWFGLNNSDLDDILPNIRNFHASDAVGPPLGFMQP